jgi:hypothetical protein
MMKSKKIVLPVVAFVLMCSVCIFGSACSLFSAASFNKSLKGAEEYTFKVYYTDTAKSTAPVYVVCTKKGDAYAYRFSKSGYDNKVLSYRHLFTGGAFYEIEERRSDESIVWSGSYKKTTEVDPKSDLNFIYKYTVEMISGSYASLLDEGVDTKCEGKSAQKYDFELGGASYSYVFATSDNTIIRIEIKTDTGTKTLIFREFNFSEASDIYFANPEESSYYNAVQNFTYAFDIS